MSHFKETGFGLAGGSIYLSRRFGGEDEQEDSEEDVEFMNRPLPPAAKNYSGTNIPNLNSSASKDPLRQQQAIKAMEVAISTPIFKSDFDSSPQKQVKPKKSLFNEDQTSVVIDQRSFAKFNAPKPPPSSLQNIMAPVAANDAGKSDEGGMSSAEQNRSFYGGGGNSLNLSRQSFQNVKHVANTEGITAIVDPKFGSKSSEATSNFNIEERSERRGQDGSKSLSENPQLFAQNIPIETVMTYLAEICGWSNEEVNADIAVLHKNRIRTTGNARSVSQHAWDQIHDLLPVVKDQLIQMCYKSNKSLN